MITERIGWTTIGLVVVQQEFSRLRFEKNGKWFLQMKNTSFEANTEEELLEKFLIWCKPNMGGQEE